MARPLGLEPIRKREFNVVIIVPEEKLSFKERVSEWIYHVKSFSFNRGKTLDLDIDDDMFEFLQKHHWITCRRGKYFFTKRGSRELVAFAEEEIARYQKNND